MPPMPRGEPRSVPDPAGDLYDQQMARIRAQRQAEDLGIASLPGMAQNALKTFQNGPKIARPNLAESFIPVVGPAWEAAADLQDGDYGGTAFNGAAAVLDALPIGVGLKGLRAASRGIEILKKGSVSANAAAKAIRKAGLAGAGQEIHHTIPLNGLSRTAQDWRNHYALLKVLPTEVHRRLHSSWGNKEKYKLLGRLWHGTTDWQKAAPTGLLGYLADTWENLTHPFAPPSDDRGSGDDDSAPDDETSDSFTLPDRPDPDNVP